MTVTAPRGFRAGGIAAGIRSDGRRDLALVVNDGPSSAAAAVFTANRVQAAPVRWSQRVLRNGRVRAIVLNSGSANACTGQSGFEDTVRTADHAAVLLGVSRDEVAVCSTGVIGQPLPMSQVIPGVSEAFSALSGDAAAGLEAASAIMTTDTVPKMGLRHEKHFSIGAIAKGAGMLAPGLATMLAVITTDADLTADQLEGTLRRVCARTFDCIDSDGCMSTNDSVLLLASGASMHKPSVEEFETALEAVCTGLVEKLLADAEGATKDITIEVVGADSVPDALVVGRAVARSNLLKCAMHGEDPNWGRIVAAIGTTEATYDPERIDVAINGVWVCRAAMRAEDETKVDMSGRRVHILIDLHAGQHEGSILTNDLTAGYVYENSAYTS